MEDAESVARQIAATIINERGYDSLQQIRHLNSGGGNFTSALFEITIKTKDEKQIKLFAKVAIVSDKLRDVMNAELLYSTERLIYCEITNIYDEIQTKAGVDVFKFPEMFACSGVAGKETVVLEDLTAKGYKTPQRTASIDWKFAASAVTKLAAFHALSFAFEKQYPEKFNLVAEQLRHKAPKRDDSTKEIWMKIVKGGVDVVKNEYKEKLTTLLCDTEAFYKFKQPISRTVLIHGDYRLSNMMCKEQGKDIDVMVVDYQTVHSGCPVADLLYFVFLGTDQEFRRNYYDNLIELYHKELLNALRNLGVDEDVYPKDVYLSELKEMLPHALRTSVVLLPLVMVDEESAPKVAGDSDISQFALAPTQGFAERFSGLVEDCAGWGAL